MATSIARQRSSLAPSVLERPYYERLYALEEHHGWHQGMRAYSRALLRQVLRSGAIRRVLDVGCGTGGMLTWLRTFAGVSGFGLEYSRHALAFCQARGHAQLAEGSGLFLPFVDGTFDLVVCADVLQHLPFPPGAEVALAEAQRVLRPGGFVFVRTNSGWGEGALRSATYRRYLRADLIEDVTAAGFTVERASYANVLPALPTLVRRKLRWGITRHDGHARPQGHAPVDSGLRLRPRPSGLRWVDAALAGILHAEALALAGLGLDLPLGDSLLILARKPATPESLA